ncbi:hypothetical protein FOCG_18185 [Fusarium oxysporum f. sp. radicis-lycopersici 26381]|nr:hypothetical protein FOCG_18185 [Fusarium oxysporum f. sp. radicis-lycopersici 26381]
MAAMAHDGVQTPRRHGDADAVVHNRPPEIELDPPEHRPRQVQQANDAAQVRVKQDEACATDGHVRAGADGDADVGGCECGGVVDAVADHGDCGAAGGGLGGGTGAYL